MRLFSHVRLLLLSPYLFFWVLNLAFIPSTLLYGLFDQIVIEPQGGGEVFVTLSVLPSDLNELVESYEAIANPGFEFVGWQGDHMGANNGMVDNYYLHRWDMDQNEPEDYKTLTARFSKVASEYLLESFYEVKIIGEGLIYFNSEEISEGLIQETYEAVPEEGYAFMGWSLFYSDNYPYKIYKFHYDPKISFSEKRKFITARFGKICDHPELHSSNDQIEGLNTYEDQSFRNGN